MSTNTKNKWLGALLGLCIVAIGIESYYLWSINKRVKTTDTQNLSASWPNTWNPWSDNRDPSGQFMQLQKQMNKMMSQMAPGNSIFSHQGFGLSPSSPKISMQDEADQYRVTVQVPKGEDVEVNTNLTGNQLTISGKVKQTQQKQTNSFHGQSLAVSQFSQTMDFPAPIDDSGVKVKHKHNEIVITVPKVS